jgi:WD40 repeat protein/predicted MPP superfamily phosphohydrolase
MVETGLSMKIKWLQFSDLNFSVSTSFDAGSAKATLLTCLSELRKETGFNYVFITGDLADKNDYTSDKTYVKDILDSAGVASCNVFWAAGNHDIRHSKMRNSIIDKIRGSTPPSREFEAIMKEEDKRDFLTNISMSDYIREYEQLFNRKLSPEEISNAHVSYSLEHCNIVVLNTCLTSSYDDKDQGHLMIMEPNLLSVFDNLRDKNKPLIVLGHHSRDFFNIKEQGKLSTLFDRVGVDIYLCGHAPHLGCSWFNNTNQNTLQITCGNNTLENNSSIFSFIIGEYDTDTLTLQITPYSYSKHNKTFHKNNNILSCLTQNNLILTRLKDLPSEKTEHPLEYIYLFDRLQDYYTLLNKRFSLLSVDKKLFPKVRGKTDERIYESIPNLCSSLVSSTMDRTMLIVGEGGTGKTTALLLFGQTLLKNKRALPLYVPLNEYTTKSNFIQEYIKTNYEQIDIDTLKYNFVLLLDGFNEMPHNDPLPLMQEIDKLLTNKSSNINVIITSRDAFTTDYLIKFQQYDVQPLDTHVVKEYLDSDSSVANELYSPMMLALYKKTDEQKKQVQEKNVPIDFKDGLKRGEILYNYLLGQIATCVIRSEIDQIVPVWYALFEVAPYIAYDMETSDKYYIKDETLKQKISMFCEQFPVEQQIKNLSERLQSLINREGHQPKVSGDRVQTILMKEQDLLRSDESGQCIFRHQHFRDFLSAFYIAKKIRNSLIVSVPNFQVPDEVSSRDWQDYICEMLGDYYGDYKHHDKYDPVYRTELHDLLDRLRGPHRVESGYTVNNIIKTWCKARDNRIVGEDFTLLDLSQVSLNGIILSEGSTFSSFDGSIVSKGTLIPQGHFGAVRSAVYSGDGKRILSASYDGTVKEWDRETEQCLCTLKVSSDRVNSVRYSKVDDDHILVTTKLDGLTEWNRKTMQLSRPYNGSEGHKSNVCSAVYSEDGKRILSASYDGTVKEWDRETKQCLHTYIDMVDSKKFEVRSAEYGGENGEYILAASHDGTVKEWNRETKLLHIFTGHGHWVRSAIYSPDEGNKYVLSASEDGDIREWDRATRICCRVFKGSPNWVHNVVFSADGRRVLTAVDRNIVEWAKKEGESEKDWVYSHIFSGHSDFVRSAVYSADGKRILSASYDGTVKEWDRETGKCEDILSVYSDRVNIAVYSKDETRVLFALCDGTIMEWGRQTEEILHIFKGHKKEVGSMVYDGDDKYVLSASEDGTVREWDRKTETLLSCYNHGDSVYSVRYSYDASCILSASIDHTIKEYNKETRLEKIFGVNTDEKKHKSRVFSAVYNHKETHILSASYDGTVKEWNRETGKCVHTFEDLCSGVKHAVYSDNEDTSILSISNNGVIVKWVKENELVLDKKQLFYGVFLKGCSFKGCNFLTKEIKKIVQLYYGNVLNTFITAIWAQKLREETRETCIFLDDKNPKNLLITGSNGSGKTILLMGLHQAIETIFKSNMETIVNGDMDTGAVSVDFSGNNPYEAVQVLQRERLMQYYRYVFIPARSYTSAMSSKEDDASSKFWNKVDNIRISYKECKRGDPKRKKLKKSWKNTENMLQRLFANNTIRLDYDRDHERDNNFCTCVHYKLGNISSELKLNRDALPDGFNSVLRIIWTIINPWEDTTSSFESIRGLVVIDELETHLHVQMQKTILPCLMALFPEVQFIVTTHSPYVLNSAKNVVIYDMENGETARNSEIHGLRGYYVDNISQKLLRCPGYSKDVCDKLNEYVKLCDEKNEIDAYKKYVELNEILADDAPLKSLLRKQMRWFGGTKE